jgi:hypothetical protein
MVRSIKLVPSSTAVDEPLVERAVADLRRIVVGGQVNVLVTVGDYILEHFFGGDAERVTSRLRSKEASVRRLAKRAGEFGMTASGVLRCVPIALQARQLGLPLAQRLPATQHVVLLPLHDRKQKRELAEAAIAEGWTVSQLRRQVKRLHRPHAGGRPREPAIRRLVTRLEAAFEDLPQGDAGIDALSPADRRHLLGRVNSLQAALERLERKITTRMR